MTLLIPTALLCSCISFAGIPDARTLSGLHSIEKVHFFPQEDQQCGPASLAAVLSYWGVAVAPEEISKAIYSESAGGTLGIDMVLYARSRGLEASQYSGGWDDLRKNIDSGYPLIVLVDYGFSLFQVNHFMVVTGYNEDNVVANSGKVERKVIPRGDFLKIWQKTKSWTLLITNKK